MGKIVKYCNACEEGFAEKFGFCPNCGAQLTAFELNPLAGNAAADMKMEPVKAEAPPAPPVVEAPVETEVPKTAETQTFSADAGNGAAETTNAFTFDDEVFETPAEETKSFETAETPKTTAVNNDNLYEATYARTSGISAETGAPHYEYDGGYQPTIVVEKNVKQRNTLLLGFFVLGCAVMVGSYVYSIFNKFLDIAAIDTPTLFAYVQEVEPPTMDLEEEQKKDDDKGGGGGGGGKEEETPASKGREAAQSPDPQFAPTSKTDQLTNPTIPIQFQTKNKNERPAENSDMPYGLKNGGNVLSDGMGSGGGLGEGRGRGQGTGSGGGLGSGDGDGRGGGTGDGEGDGTGPGGGNTPTVKTKPSPPVGPTEGVKILAKPKALYTDAARQNNVQGKVVLRVTFTANGSIGSISVISGLGSGLTEQAIAAARGIRFEPAKRGGVPYTVSKPVEYSFTIY